jgi:hypothetical protein
MKKPFNPQLSQEWQDAVNTAEFLLLLESARGYGLITGGPTVNVERCMEILELGREKGFFPQRLDREARG